VISILSDDLVVEGNLSGEGEVQLDGLIRGDVRVHRLTIGARGCVDGAVTAETVEIYGRAQGVISARHVRMYQGAQVTGDVTHEELMIEAGAIFQGRSLRPTSAVAPIVGAQAASGAVGLSAKSPRADVPPPALEGGPPA
jgi:cytoskeletal protein CcmA (bactofilin family)